ncbi:MAG TPA: SWIM zinc finger family protein [Aggregatilineales bacterium]|nr:SWIM zinc finger family protein [Aggregatilineales bacterium]
MAKRRSSYSDDDEDWGWGFFPRSKPIKPKDGIQSKSKKGAFRESWWAKRWILVLEGYGIGTRLQRGRSYARGGQVLNIAIKPGEVTARVQGSRPTPYRITIRMPRLSDIEWEKVIDAMGAQAIFAAKLLAGEMPNAIEEAFSAAKVSLFPARGDQLITDCSCPDVANPCKHIAAVYYLLGEQFDTDPLLIFTLRGRTRDQIIEALRARRAASAAETPGETQGPPELIPALAEQVDSFWEVGDLSAFSSHIAAPEVPLAVLRRLGKSPAGTYDTLSALYQAMTAFTLDKVFGND